ncbi:rhamnan synthesis F family protein [Parvibaculum sp.]|uniref:rhamnan synthesis F family protein n=1 Tax=Parvibaculum sp. TaxID=2024848 RepID=UPI0034A08E7A
MVLHASVCSAAPREDGRSSLRLTLADAAPLPAGRYLLRASMPLPDAAALTIEIAAEGGETARGDVDVARSAAGIEGAPRAATPYVPIVLTQDAAALVITADGPADMLARLDWRLQHRGYARFYAGLTLRFVLRLLAGRESYPMFREAIRRNGIRGVGAAARGDWGAALALPVRRSGFTKGTLDYPERVGAAVRPPVLVPSLQLIADFSRGGSVPEIDAALLTQARLAGFSGLCLPCGWDGARLSLPGPVERFLADAARDFPFVLRRVDGEGEPAFIAAIAPYLDDSRSLPVGTDAGALSTGAGGEADKGGMDGAARLPDTPPVLFGRAVHAALGAALREAEGRAAPALVFIDLVRRDEDGPTLAEDRRYGYAWVEALRVAQARHAAAAPRPRRPLRAALAVHAFYPDVFAEILEAMRDVPPEHKLFVTTTAERRTEIERLLAAAGRDHILRVFDNRGRDILPFLNIYDEICAEGFDLVAKVHTKRSVHRKDGEDWRRRLVEPIAGRDGFGRILAAFEKDASLGMTGPDRHLAGLHDNVVANEARVFGLAQRLGLSARDVTRGRFFAGSMFVARLPALEPLMSLAIGADDFEPEEGQLDGTLAHVIERGFALSAISCGMRVAGVEDVLRRDSVLWTMSG